MLKNIIFDLGGVFIEIDYPRTSRAFGALGVLDFDDHFSQFKADAFFEGLETGKVSEAGFFANMKTICAPGTTDDQVRNAWNAMLGDLRPASLDFLETIKDRYRIYLLSNTNAIHLEAMSKKLLEEMGKPSLDG